MQSLGRFISIEGMDGAGKTSVMSSVVAWLTQHHYSVVTTREPGGTPLAEQIRGLLLTPSDEIMDADTELLLMMAARNQHVKTHILPALQAGQWVVSDRFLDASYAYQGGGRGMSFARIEQLHHWAIGDFKPSLTLLLDVPVAVGKSRVSHRGEAETRFEQEEIAFFERIRDTYLARAYADPARVVVIDASQSAETVKETVLLALQTRLLDKV